MKTIALTGATSMTGVALIKQCISRDVNVIAFVRPNSRNIQRLPQSGLIKIVETNLENMELAESCIKADVFFHIGWMNNARQERDSWHSQIPNITYGINSVHLAKKMGCFRYIYLGSQSEVGLSNLPINQKTFIDPVTVNGIFKYTVGKLTLLECQKLKLGHIWIRLVSEYGTNDHEDRLIKQFIKNCKSDISMALSDCFHIWDFIYEDDVGEALLLVGQKGQNKKIYTLGSGTGKPLKEYLETIKEMVNPGYNPGYGQIAYNENSIQYLCADISELTADTGWKPKYSFEEGIQSILRSNYD